MPSELQPHCLVIESLERPRSAEYRVGQTKVSQFILHGRGYQDSYARSLSMVTE